MHLALLLSVGSVAGYLFPALGAKTDGRRTGTSQAVFLAEVGEKLMSHAIKYLPPCMKTFFHCLKALTGHW